MARVDPIAAANVMGAAGVIPRVPYPGPRKPWPCQCGRCGRSVSPTYDSVRSGNNRTGCRDCGRQEASDKHRANGEAIAVALAVARGLKPLEPYPGLCTPWRCLCTRCGAEVKPRFTTIKSTQGGGCKPCGDALRAAKQRGPADVAVADLQAAGFDPLEDFPGVMNPWRVQCRTCKRPWDKTLNDIRTFGTGCSYCSKKFVDPDEADAVMRDALLDPLVTYPGCNEPWSCRCLTCGRIVEPRYSYVNAGGAGCIHCSRRKVDPADAVALMRSADLEPQEAYRRSKSKWRCRCLKCGRIVFPSHSNIMQGVGGCSDCATGGFHAGKAAMVYLAHHSVHSAVKIGITNLGNDRVDRHRSHGWRMLALEHAVGETAIAIEKAILSGWRKDLGLPPYLSKYEMPQGGWTETVDADAIDIPATIERIKQLAADGGEQANAA